MSIRDDSHYIIPVVIQTAFVVVYLCLRFKVKKVREVQSTTAAHLLATVLFSYALPISFTVFVEMCLGRPIEQAVPVGLNIAKVATIILNPIGDIIVLPKMLKLKLTTVDGFCLFALNWLAYGLGHSIAKYLTGSNL
jgi:hypothetical protein